MRARIFSLPAQRKYDIPNISSVFFGVGNCLFEFVPPLQLQLRTHRVRKERVRSEYDKSRCEAWPKTKMWNGKSHGATNI
jgi:hypothetical protein